MLLKFSIESKYFSIDASLRHPSGTREQAARDNKSQGTRPHAQSRVSAVTSKLCRVPDEVEG